MLDDILMVMKDSKGQQIKEGQTLKRIVDGMAVDAGHEYTVILRKWNDTDDTAALIADGGFVKEMLSVELAKEFEVTKTNE